MKKYILSLLCVIAFAVISYAQTVTYSCRQIKYMSPLTHSFVDSSMTETKITLDIENKIITFETKNDDGTPNIHWVNITYAKMIPSRDGLTSSLLCYIQDQTYAKVLFPYGGKGVVMMPHNETYGDWLVFSKTTLQ